MSESLNNRLRALELATSTMAAGGDPRDAAAARLAEADDEARALNESLSVRLAQLAPGGLPRGRRQLTLLIVMDRVAAGLADNLARRVALLMDAEAKSGGAT